MDSLGLWWIPWDSGGFPGTLVDSLGLWWILLASGGVQPEYVGEGKVLLMPDSKIFVTTNANDTGSGAILFFGPSYGTTHPVAYNS